MKKVWLQVMMEIMTLRDLLSLLLLYPVLQVHRVFSTVDLHKKQTDHVTKLRAITLKAVPEVFHLILTLLHFPHNVSAAVYGNTDFLFFFCGLFFGNWLMIYTSFGWKNTCSFSKQEYTTSTQMYWLSIPLQVLSVSSEPGRNWIQSD